MRPFHGTYTTPEDHRIRVRLFYILETESVSHGLFESCAVKVPIFARMKWVSCHIRWRDVARWFPRRSSLGVHYVATSIYGLFTLNLTCASGQEDNRGSRSLVESLFSSLRWLSHTKAFDSGHRDLTRFISHVNRYAERIRSGTLG
jgi:hypothetical protein